MKDVSHNVDRKSLNDYYSIVGTADEKINFLQKSKPVDGLAIARYPSGTEFGMLQRVNRYIKESTLTVEHYFMKTTVHGVAFLLVKKGTDFCEKCEQIRAKTGGIHSTEIDDRGEFLIVRVSDGIIEEGCSFGLYKVDDDFMGQFK